MSHSFSQFDSGVFKQYYAGIEPETAVKLFTKLTNLFEKNIDQKIENLGQMLKKEDRSGAHVLAHQLKGSLLSLGGVPLSKAFKEIEFKVSTAEMSELITLLENTSKDLALFREELKSWVSTLSVDSPR